MSFKLGLQGQNVPKLRKCSLLSSIFLENAPDELHFASKFHEILSDFVCSYFRLWACTCNTAPVFDLLAHDRATFVVEVEVLHKVPEPPIVDTVSREKPRLPEPPPTPRISPNYYEDFQIQILANFKGDASTVYQLRTYGRNSSCYWAPKPGDKFLIYTDALAIILRYRRRQVRRMKIGDQGVSPQMMRYLLDWKYLYPHH